MSNEQRNQGPGRRQYDGTWGAKDRFEAPRASLAYDARGRVHYGLEDLTPRVSQREHFELAKHEHNMKQQAQELEPCPSRVSLRETYESNLRAEAQRMEEREERTRNSRIGSGHHLYRMSEDNPLRVQSAVDAALPVKSVPSDGLPLCPRGKVQPGRDKPFAESTAGPAIPGDVNDEEWRRYEMRQKQARELYEACKRQEAIELSVYTDNPHGLTIAQQREYRDQGFRVRGLGYGEKATANTFDKRVLR